MQLEISPFIEGTNIQYIWDSTSLGFLKECSRKYYYAMIEGWRPKDENIHIKFGQIYHSALETYYKTRHAGADHEEALRVSTQLTLTESFGMPTGDSYKNRENLVRSVIWYLEEFKDDAAKTMIIGGKPAIELTFKYDLGFGPGPGYVMAGHIDRLVEFTEQVYVMDHKTTKSALGSHYFNYYSPDNQISLYMIAAQIVYDTPSRGVMIDAAQIAVGFTRFDRGVAYRRPSELAEWMHDLEWWLDSAKRSAETGHWPLNDKACRMCQFRGVCSKEVSFRPIQLASDFTQANKWNPAASR